MILIDNIKQKLQTQVYKNAHVFEYKGEEIIVKKSKIPIIGGDFKQVSPVIKDNKVQFINLIIGGWRNFVRLMILMAILSYAYYSYTGLLGESKEYMDGSKYVIIGKMEYDKYCETIKIVPVDTNKSKIYHGIAYDFNIDNGPKNT